MKKYFITIAALVFVLLVAFVVWLNPFSWNWDTLSKAHTSTLAQQDNIWQTYTSTADHFSILFPGYPITSSKTSTVIGLGPYTIDTTYVVEQNQNAFLVQDTIFQNSIKSYNPQTFLDNILDNEDTGQNLQLVSSSSNTYNSYPTLDYITRGPGGVFFKGRMLLIGQIVYDLSYYYQVNVTPYVDTDYQKFISSFQVQ